MINIMSPANRYPFFQSTFWNSFSRIFFFFKKTFPFWFKFRWTLSPSSKTIGKYWFRYWIGAEQPASHYMNQWWPIEYIYTYIYIYTPFAKSNGRFFQKQKINKMPLSNLYDFWWVHKMHASVHFLCKIYCLFALTRSALGFKMR